MNVFISWSGDRSHEVARQLKWLLERCAPNAKCWLSDDIPDGKLWRYVLAEALEASGFGICCVTRENREAPWLLFEAGAIAKAVGDDARLVPYLLDLEPTDLEEPLAGFQMRRSTEGETRRMVLAIGREGNVSEHVLADHFEHYWPDVAEKLDELRQSEPVQGAENPEPIRSHDEMLRELLERTRRIEQMGDVLPSASRSLSKRRFVLDSLRRDLLVFPEVHDVEFRWQDHKLMADFELNGLEGIHFRDVISVPRPPERWDASEYRFVVHEVSDLAHTTLSQESPSVGEPMNEQVDSPTDS